MSVSTANFQPKRPAAVKSSPTPNAGGTIPTRFTPKFLADADRRVATIRTLQSRINRLREESGCDSYAKELLIARAVFIACQLESNEVLALEGTKPLDVGVFTQGCNCLQGLLKSIGLERKSKRVGSLKEYVNSHSGTDQSEDES